MRPALATIPFTTAAAALRSETSSVCAVNAFACANAFTPAASRSATWTVRAAVLQSDGNRLADALRGAGYERDAAIVADVHVSISSWNVAKDERAAAVLDVVDQRDQPVDRGRRDAGLARQASR